MPIDPRAEPNDKPTDKLPTPTELLDTILKKLDVVATDVKLVAERVDGIEAWKADTTTRLESSSLRVKSTSENDLKQDAAIGVLVADVAAVKQSVARINEAQATAAEERASTAADIAVIKGAVTSYFAKRPNLVAGIIGSIITLVLAGIAAATAWLQGLGKH